MARYGRIKHQDCGNTNYIKFENVAARREFAEEFEAYHASHDHDGAVPVFEEINTADVNSYHTAGAPTWGDKYLTIDGYKANEILSYHRWDGVKRSYNEPRYRPPTSCISPLIVLEEENLGGDGPFVDSGAFERHELSAIFMDMPEADFENLLKSVEADGFIDNHIRVHEGKILDGWHRYRAALELNIVRKLRFTVWNAEDEGDPAAFVMARNLERRHLTSSQRGQIVVRFNERAGAGNPNLTSPNGEVKTREQLAKEASVGTSTIDRAVKVEKAGRGDEVIAGEKTQSEVIKEETIKTLLEDLSAEMGDWKQRHIGVSYASKSSLIQAYREQRESEQEGDATVEELKGILGLMNEDSKAYAIRVRYLQSDERQAFETAQSAYFKERTDFHEKIEEKGIALSDFVESVAIHYHRTNIAGMFVERSEILKDDTLTTETFQDWTGFLRVLCVDLKANAPWVPVSEETEAEQETESAKESLPLQEAMDEMKADQETEDKSEADEFKATLESNRVKAQDANIAMWKAFEKSELSKYLDKDDLQEVASKNLQCPAEFPDPMNMKRPEIWVCWFNAITRTLEQESGWVKALLDEYREDERLDELEGARDNAKENRRRIWIAFGESDISKSISKEDFALAAAKQHGLYEEADYGSGENYLLGKDYAPIDKLNLKKAQEMKAFFNSVRTAIRESADWVLELVETTDEVVEATESEEEINKIADEVRVKKARSRFWRARDEKELHGLSAQEFVNAAVASLGLSEDAGQYFFESVEDPLLDLPPSGLKTWIQRFDLLTSDIKHRKGWTSDAEKEDSNRPETDVISEARAQVTEIINGLDAPKSTNGAANGAKSNYRLEYLSIGLRDADGNSVSPLKFQLIASRQLDEHPLKEVPDALKVELLKLVERLKS